MDWHHSVDINFEEDRDCDAFGCDSYCRCSQIVSAMVESVNIDYCIDNIIEHICIGNVPRSNKLIYTRALDRAHELRTDESSRYVVDRILRHYKIYDFTLFEVNTRSGYYGEEIGSVSHKNSDEIIATCQKILSLKTLTEKINALLELEYGYVLPRLKGATWELIEIEKSSIIFPQNEYKKKIKNSVYSDYKLPVALVDEELKLIDGYHRVTSCNSERVKVFKATVLP